MKKKRNLICFLCLIFCFVLLVGTFPSIFYFKSYATTSNSDIKKSNYSNYDFDESLFNAIFAIAKALNYNQYMNGFDRDLFTNDYDKYSYSGDNEEIISQRNAIVNDINAGIIDLTTGENAKYDCLKDISPIKSIVGLNALEFSTTTVKIKTLILDNNKITDIQDLESVDSLENLSIRNNELAFFKLNKNLKEVKSIDLSNNFLEEIDLSVLKYKDNIHPNVNLSNNNIENISKINFSTEGTLGKLNLNFNNLTNLTDENIDNLETKIQSDVNSNLIIGVQGLNCNSSSLIAGQQIVVYKEYCLSLSQINLKAYYDNNSEFYNGGVNNFICSSITEGNYEKLFLPAGKIKINFYNGLDFISNSNVNYEDYDDYYSKSIEVKIPKINIILKNDEKVLDNTYQESDFVVEFNVENNANIPNIEDVLENAKIYCSKTGNYGNTSSSSVTIDSNGTFNCSGYAVFDGVNSDTFSTKVTRKNVKGIILGIVIVVIIIVAITSFYYILRWYREGATVAPLSEKEISVLRKKKRREEVYDKTDYILQLDKPRHSSSVGGNEVDDVLGNLNDDINSAYNSNEKDDYSGSNYDYQVKGNSYDKYNQEEFSNDFNNDLGNENGDTDNTDLDNE